ncbi:MAG: LytTR family transcriptional regulator DNA-binding domain-containing protein [Lachnospiraceae bacterium]|nr:LytTR family transcriptional regulator DNA-binding domain-containing protein [Lachnospiraceae bacterium]
MLPQRQIIRLYIHNRKLMVQTAERLYEVRKPLREVEELLDQSRFVRISQSETINLRRVKSFDFSTVGTIGVELENGETTWVARRRVKDVKEALARGDHNEHQK